MKRQYLNLKLLVIVVASLLVLSPSCFLLAQQQKLQQQQTESNITMTTATSTAETTKNEPSSTDTTTTSTARMITTTTTASAVSSSSSASSSSSPQSSTATFTTTTTTILKEITPAAMSTNDHDHDDKIEKPSTSTISSNDDGKIERKRMDNEVDIVESTTLTKQKKKTNNDDDLNLLDRFLGKEEEEKSSPEAQTRIGVIQASLHDNSLRAGFEQFYRATNYVLDNVFGPPIPANFARTLIHRVNMWSDRFFSEANSSSRLFLKNEWHRLVITPFEYYPSLTALVLATLFLVFFIPTVGFLLMCHRCLCRGKFNPFDSKRDSLRRKLNATCLFVLLVCIFLLTVVLFFTNLNSAIAIRKVPNTYQERKQELDTLMSRDLPDFLEQAPAQVESFKKNASQLFDTTVLRALNETVLRLNISEKVVNDFNTHVSDELSRVVQLYTRLFPSAKEKGASLVDKLQAYVNLLTKISDENDPRVLQLQQLDTLLKDLKEQYGPFMTLASSSNTDNKMTIKSFTIERLMVELSKQLNDPMSEAKTKFMRVMSDVLDRVAGQLKAQSAKITQHSLPETHRELNATSKIVELSLRHVRHYYDYFYWTLVGVSAFMLFLFIVYAIGLSGMCARRTHHNYKQKCHRGITANFLMFGVAIYFLFASCLLVVCIVMYVPGIVARHGVCLPSIQMDSNPLVQQAKLYVQDLQSQSSNDKSQANSTLLSGFGTKLAHLNVSRLIDDCHRANHSAEIEALLFSQANHMIRAQTASFIGDETLDQAISDIEVPPFQASVFLNGVEKFLDQFKSIFSENKNEKRSFKEKLADASKMVDELKAQLNEKQEGEATMLRKEDLDELQSLITTSSALISNRPTIVALDAQFTEIKRTLASLQNEKNFFGDILNHTIRTYTLKEINMVVAQGTRSYIQRAPSCRIISNTYESVVLTGCYEILDNTNAFWFTLYVLILLHLIVVGFGVSQTDLYRKFYAYDELMSEEGSNHSEQHKQAIYPTLDGYDVYQSRDSNNSRAPIDAYEMNGYKSSSNGNNKNNHHNHREGGSKKHSANNRRSHQQPTSATTPNEDRDQRHHQSSYSSGNNRNSSNSHHQQYSNNNNGSGKIPPYRVSRG